MVYIITVNYRTSNLVKQCLLSLNAQKIDAQRAQFPDIKVVVVDNHSEDDSVPDLRAFIQSRGWEAWVDLLPMPKNGGFAYGCNAGIRHVFAQDSADSYVMLLNPDTEVRIGAVATLSAFLDAHPKVGIVGSQLENSTGGIERSAHTFHSPISEMLEGARLGVLSRMFQQYETSAHDYHETSQCDWVSGSSMMIRKRLIDDIGMLDEAYFLYFEEVDFFYRAAKAGWQTWYVPDAKVMHIEGAATGIKLSKRRPAYWYNSRRRYFIKHHGVLGLILADMLWFLGRLSFVTRRFFKLGAQKTYHDPKYLMWDLLSGDVASVLTGRAWRLEKEKVE